MNRLFYALAILLMLYASIFYDVIYFRAFLVILLVLPFVLYGIARHQKQNLTITLHTNAPSARKKSPFTVQVIVDNDSKIPVSRLAIRLSFENQFSPDTGKVNLNGIADNESVSAIHYTVTSEFCGRLSVKADSIKIYDVFGITFCRLGSIDDLSILVMPEIHNMDVRISDSTCSFPVNSDEYDAHQSGDDPSEIFAFREYQGGDRFNQINWKLSMKTENLIVKEFSRPIGYSVVLLLDFAGTGSGLPEAGRIDNFIETAVSISSSLLNVSCYHYVSWYSEAENNLVRHSVKNHDDLFDMLIELLIAKPYKETFNLADLYHNSYVYDTHASQLLLDMDLGLQANNQERILFKPDRLGNSLAAASIVV